MVVIGELRDAFGWARRSPVILAVIALAAAAGLFVMSRFTPRAPLVRDVLRTGPAGLGLMTMAGGFGSLLGSLSSTRPAGGCPAVPCCSTVFVPRASRSRLSGHGAGPRRRPPPGGLDHSPRW